MAYTYKDCMKSKLLEKGLEQCQVLGTAASGVKSWDNVWSEIAAKDHCDRFV